MSCPCCNSDYHKAGLIAIRDNRILLCRKRAGTSSLILPGGCIEPGEPLEACLRREIHEELGPAVGLHDLEFIATYSDVAAGEARKSVRIELFKGELIGDPAPHSEIAELIWFGPDGDRAVLAPSIANTILPDLLARKILPWPLTSAK